MPTPPTGVMTCAASPINSMPGAYQRSTRPASTDSKDVCRQSEMSSMRSASHAARLTIALCSGEPSSAQPLVGALGENVANLPHVGPVHDDDEAVRAEIDARGTLG